MTVDGDRHFYLLSAHVG